MVEKGLKTHFFKTDLNGWKRLKMIENSLKQSKAVQNVLKELKMVKKGWNWLKMVKKMFFLKTVKNG